ncbi:MAG TPA: hypothetical protein DCG79_03635 [Clostridiales bacterium]|nr:hypothetical protein [Clostridiales bacterium]
MKVEISLGAIKRNSERIAKTVDKPLIPMLKADAYGHGAARVARAISAEYYGVATEEEGVPLREAGKQILVTAPSFSSVGLCRRYDMIPLIGDFDVAKRAAALGVKRCHIKVNSGMNRLGFRPEECREITLFLTRAGVKIEGAATHYKESSVQNVLCQNEAFRRAIRAIKNALSDAGGEEKLVTSVTGCGAPFSGEFDYLRVGLALYGYPTDAVTKTLSLEKAMKVSSEVIKTKIIEEGETLGYSGVFRAPKRLKAYTVLGGYGDGVARSEVGRKVLSAGRRLTIAAVSMDSFEMISDHVDLKVGRRVIILSKEADACYVAAKRGTIPYEVLLGYDVPRAEKVYV